MMRVLVFVLAILAFAARAQALPEPVAEALKRAGVAIDSVGAIVEPAGGGAPASAA